MNFRQEYRDAQLEKRERERERGERLEGEKFSLLSHKLQLMAFGRSPLDLAAVVTYPTPLTVCACVRVR